MAKRGRPRKNPLPEEAGSPTTQSFSPPATAVRDYDDLVREVRDLEEMTATRGWARFYGDLLSARDTAKIGLLSAEKMVEVVKAQATVHLVEEQIKRLTEPVTRINEMREKYPLFKTEFTYSGKLDVDTGRVTLVIKNGRNGTTQNVAAVDEPGVTVAGVEAGNAVTAEAATEAQGDAAAAQHDAAAEGVIADVPAADAPESGAQDTSGTETAGDGAVNAEGDDDAGGESSDEEGDDNDEGLTDEDEPGDDGAGDGDEDPFGD